MTQKKRTDNTRPLFVALCFLGDQQADISVFTQIYDAHLVGFRILENIEGMPEQVELLCRLLRRHGSERKGLRFDQLPLLRKYLSPEKELLLLKRVLLQLRFELGLMFIDLPLDLGKDSVDVVIEILSGYFGAYHIPLVIDGEFRLAPLPLRFEVDGADGVLVEILVQTGYLLLHHRR